MTSVLAFFFGRPAGGQGEGGHFPTLCLANYVALKLLCVAGRIYGSPPRNRVMEGTRIDEL